MESKVVWFYAMEHSKWEREIAEHISSKEQYVNWFIENANKIALTDIEVKVNFVEHPALNHYLNTSILEDAYIAHDAGTIIYFYLELFTSALPEPRFELARRTLPKFPQDDSEEYRKFIALIERVKNKEIAMLGAVDKSQLAYDHGQVKTEIQQEQLKK